MIEWAVQTLFIILFVLPFISLGSAIYLGRLVKETVQPPILLVLLTIQAIVSLLCSSYLAVLRINISFFGGVISPDLLPLTLLGIIAPLVMINIIALMLWRVRGPKGTKGARGPKGDTGEKGPKGDTGGVKNK